MREMHSLSLHFDGSNLRILDQTLLPYKEEWKKIITIEQMCEAILKLRVRGAPLIGVAAAIFLARQAELFIGEKELLKMGEQLKDTRPTAVNLAQAVDRMFKYSNFERESFVKTAERIYLEDIERCQKIAEHGSVLIKNNESVLTHCNTGGLATAGIGTAIGIMNHAFNIEKKKFHVFVDETRPLLQGGRLTTWEMQKLKISHTLLCDNMAAVLMRAGKVNSVMVGSDRIAANGDFANKVGTYGLAVLAKAHRVPFYVAAPYTTVDIHTKSGENIPIEERPAYEVRGVRGSFGEVLWAPKESAVFNPAFDVTPAELVSAWITDFGLFDQKDVKEGCFKKMPMAFNL